MVDDSFLRYMTFAKNMYPHVSGTPIEYRKQYT